MKSQILENENEDKKAKKQRRKKNHNKRKRRYKTKMHSDEDAKERICIGAKNKSLQVINSACMYNRTQNKTNKNKNAKKTQNPARKLKNVYFFFQTRNVLNENEGANS